MSDELYLTKEEIAYIDKVSKDVVDILSVGKLLLISTQAAEMATNSFLNDEPDNFIGLVYGLLCYGYILRDEKDMNVKHNFKIDDFLGDK